MTKLKLAMKLKDIDKPNLRKDRHKISKKEIDDYFKDEVEYEEIDG